MGYRHYLAIIDKETFKNINEDFILRNSDEDGYWGIYDLAEKYGVEIAELGKYSDEGFRLCDKKTKIPDEYLNAYNVIKEHCDNYEFGFNVLTKRDLIFLIRCYKMRTIKYWKSLLGIIEDKFDNNSPEVKCKNYVRSKLNWRKYLTDEKNPYKVQDTWMYEYQMFNLLHCYKMIDWDKYVLIIYGW